MDPNLHHTPLHWGYPATPPQNPWVPPQTRSMKRALSESDCEELYSEESSKEQTSPGESSSCQLLSRKKRRGVIEKKRRDRINSSLSELKRLVPSAYEKQGSAKLEKAEILQLTVEHLKNLHAKGLDSIAYDPQRFAMDYHIIGFRECAAEVARYLVTIEGMDIQDPLRLRLMSHLQYFVQQRELSAKACSSPNWSSSSYQSNCAPPTYQSYPTQSSSNSYVPNLPPPIQPYPTLNPPPTTSMHQQHPVSHNTRSTTSVTATETSSLMSVPGHEPQSHLQHPQQQQQQQQQQAPAVTQQQDQQQSQQQHYSADHEHHHDHQGAATYIELTSSSHRNSSANLGYENATQYPSSNAQAYNTSGNVNYASNGAKPYRPWGAEMAY